MSVDRLIRQLRKLPWDKKSIALVSEVDMSGNECNAEQYLVKTWLKVCRTKYVDIPLVADCISGLTRYGTVLSTSYFSVASRLYIAMHV